VAAAVILFLLTGTAVVVIFNNRKSANPDKEIVNTNPGNKHVEPSNEKVNGPSIENTTTDRQLAVDRVQETDVKQSDASTAVANEKAMKQNAVKNNLPELTDSPERKEESIARNEIPQSNNLPTPVVSDESTQRVTGDIAIKENSIKEIQSPNRAVTNPSVQPSDIRTAKADNFEDDGSTEEGSGKKGALRGFFRKVTRNVEKRTGVDPTNGDNRLLVGGLSIKLK
jgi:hypothetical protein